MTQVNLSTIVEGDSVRLTAQVYVEYSLRSPDEIWNDRRLGSFIPRNTYGLVARLIIVGHPDKLVVLVTLQDEGDCYIPVPRAKIEKVTL
jgi:hypothetical protein